MLRREGVREGMSCLKKRHHYDLIIAMDGGGIPWIDKGRE